MNPTKVRGEVVSFRISKSTKEKLRKLATRDNRSANNMVITLIERAYRKQKRQMLKQAKKSNA